MADQKAKANRTPQEDQFVRRFARSDGQNFRVILNEVHKWSEQLDQIEDTLDRIEGRRFLLRVLATSVENYIENWNPDQPHFRNTVSDIRKVYADSPDTDYLRSNLLLKDNRRYSVWGVIPKTTVYMGVQLYRTKGLPGKHLADHEIKRDEKGRFELFLTAEPETVIARELRGKNILRGDGDEVAVIVRQYFTDRTAEVPLTVRIERVNNDKPLDLLNDAFFARGAQLALANINQTFTNTFQAHESLQALSRDQFVRGDGTRLFPTLDNRYMVAYFEGDQLGANLSDPKKDPVILVRGTRSKCRYFSICLYNRWLESLDYLRAPIHRSHSNTFFLPDGTYEYAICYTNPGHKNWLSTTDHRRLYAITRELLPENSDDPEIIVEFTTVGELQARKDRRFLQENVKM